MHLTAAVSWLYNALQRQKAVSDYLEVGRYCLLALRGYIHMAETVLVKGKH